jgi:hypothetical protein
MIEDKDAVFAVWVWVCAEPESNPVSIRLGYTCRNGLDRRTSSEVRSIPGLSRLFNQHGDGLPPLDVVGPTRGFFQGQRNNSRPGGPKTARMARPTHNS